MSITIRPVRPEDGPALYEIVKHHQVAPMLLQQPSMEYRETDHWLKDHKAGHNRLVAIKDGSIVGSVSLQQHQRPRRVHSGMMGIMVHPNYWRIGVGTALMEAILDLADNWLNLLRVDLGVHSNNSRAIQLYQKFGFELEGTKREAVFGEGRFLDEHIMARLQDNVPTVTTGMAPECRRRTDVIDITIRPLTIEDADDLHAIISHPAVARSLNQIPSLEVTDVKKKVEAGGPGLYRFSAVATHADGSTKMVGNVNLNQPQNPRIAHNADLGISVHPEYWGLGIGKRLMASIIDLADHWLNLRRIELEVYCDNQAAIQMYKHFGFEIEGTKHLFGYGDGRWSDAYFMARLRP